MSLSVLGFCVYFFLFFCGYLRYDFLLFLFSPQCEEWRPAVGFGGNRASFLTVLLLRLYSTRMSSAIKVSFWNRSSRLAEIDSRVDRVAGLSTSTE